MRMLLALSFLAALAVPAAAHPPHLPLPRVDHRFEPIPPLGNNLPLSYRARYNRPRYVTGAMAYLIAPTTKEAMSWHENVHHGSYRNHLGRVERHYRYPKPWEVLPVGPRTPHDHAAGEHGHHRSEPLDHFDTDDHFDAADDFGPVEPVEIEELPRSIGK